MNVSETPAKDLSPTIDEGKTLPRNIWIKLLTDLASCHRRTEHLSIKQNTMSTLISFPYYFFKITSFSSSFFPCFGAHSLHLDISLFLCLINSYITSIFHPFFSCLFFFYALSRLPSYFCIY